jgi:hypothetical protein
MASICGQPGCSTPATYRGRCQRHARERERQTNRAGSRIYRLKRWKMTRRAFLLAHPLCAAEGCTEIATDVHHIIDLAEGGDPWSFGNLEQHCHSHHSQITRARQTA